MARTVVVFAVALSLLAPAAFAELTNPSPVVVEAAGPDGAQAHFTVLVVGGNDGSNGRPADTVTCSPASGSMFPIGTTPVSCAGSEGSTGSFDVQVIDSRPPALSLPRDFTVVTTSTSGVPVTYAATANDVVDGAVSVDCAPPSGSTFAMGTTPVSCTASDSRGNAASGGFNVTVATTAPPPGNPDIVAEATSPSGARVAFNTGDSDDGDGRPGSGGCSPSPGSMFPLGETVVTCPSGNFTISVVDTTAPALALPAGIIAAATSMAGADVVFLASAFDLVDEAVPVLCTPPVGSTFALGNTTVNCSAADSRGNTATGSFIVLVTTGPVPPTNPLDVVAEATGPDGAVVTFAVGRDDREQCLPASGSTFPLGSTAVACTSGATFTVTIVDTTPPALGLPDDITAEATGPSGAVVVFAPTATDVVDGSLGVVCTPMPGSTFALGVTTVSCSANDSHGNVSTGSFTVTVVDTTPPLITSVTATPSSIWPPNKKLVKVTLAVIASDIVDPAPLVRIYDITCDEPIVPADAVITGLLTANLRADRDAHQNGRVYTLYIEAIDGSGNRSTSSVNVTVPHDQGG